MLDLWCELLDRMGELPVSRPLDEAGVARAAALPVPEQPLSVPELADLLRPLVLEHSTLCGHPGFMAYVSGSGTVPGAAADLLAAGFNPNVGGWTLSPAATELELHLMRWLAERFGLPAGAGGLMTSGGAASNLTALKAARDARTEGTSAGTAWAACGSSCTHRPRRTPPSPRRPTCSGWGSGPCARSPPTTATACASTTCAGRWPDDLAAGMHPFAVVATAGTTATGAIDPLPEVADLCAEHGLWLHVDAAYGGAAVLAPELRPLLAGDRAGRLDRL